MQEQRRSSDLPYALIEGCEPSQDLSHKWVLKYENVAEIEKGVPTHEFRESMDARDLDAEFRLLRKLTETKEHQLNQEVFEKKSVSSLLNRYSDLKPCKFHAMTFNADSSQALTSTTLAEKRRQIRLVHKRQLHQHHAGM